MNIQENNGIGALVAQDYRAASVFKKYGIDFCCQGKRTIKDACDSKNLDAKLVVTDLNSINQESTGDSIDYKSWPIDLLADYIEKKHHRYVVEKSEEIKPYLDKICRVHGERHPELFEINLHFNTTAGELAKHMKKEELVLFPFVRQMVKAKQEGKSLNAPEFGTIENPIQMMMNEHTAEGDRFRIIESLSKNYEAPQDACNTYRVAIALLKEFEADLHLHIHLENNILFPEAIKLEKQLKNV